MTDQKPWRLINGRWEQELGFRAKFYNKTIQPEGEVAHLIVVCTTKFQYHGPNIDIESTLCQAWTQMLCMFPALGAQVDNGKKIYETPDNAALAKWLASSFKVHLDNTPENVFKSVCNEPIVMLHYFRCQAN
jgi:hypothetical protein